jgi:hypothetical protein
VLYALLKQRRSLHIFHAHSDGSPRPSPRAWARLAGSDVAAKAPCLQVGVRVFIEELERGEQVCGGWRHGGIVGDDML